ncbi:MAG: dihydroorotase [Treponema sp.]|nr:dihydroorotase [Treponema sp.]
MSKVLIIFNARLVDSHLDSPGSIVIANNKIHSIFLGGCTDSKSAAMFAGATLDELNLLEKPEFIDAHGLTLMPSFVDMHVHFRYPGQTQKEDLDSGLHAAVAGGFGTVVLMPNTTPVVSSNEMAQNIIEEAEQKKLARVFQTVSITKDFAGEDTTELDNLNAAKIPVITEDGHDVESAAVMLDAMQKAGKQNVIVSCHCEDISLAKAARPFRERALGFMKKYGIPADKYNVAITNVPSSVDFEIDGNLTAANRLLALAEDTATERNIEIAKIAGCHVHIAHCSTAVSIDAVRRAKAQILAGTAPAGFDVSVEVTPHHLSLSGVEAPFLRALVNPPLRSEHDRRALIKAIKDGTVDVISTDHAPHTAEDKAAGSPGFTGLETAFAVCNTVLVQKERLPLSKLSELMSDKPAQLLNLQTGRLVIGYSADFTLVNPDERWTVDAEQFFSKGKSTPQNGADLIGRVHATYFRGEKVFELQ